MSFFKRLFGMSSDRPEVRKLEHPRDLRLGDIIKFRYMDQKDISGREFEVAQVNSYTYGGLIYPEFVLKDRDSQIIYMMIEEEDGEECLSLSKKVDKAKVFEIIPEDKMASLKTQKGRLSLELAQKLQGFEDWTTSQYHVVDRNVKGAFVKGDMRFADPDVAPPPKERFVSYLLEDPEGEFALEVEVYETGETELSVTVYNDIDEIDEMWPHA